MPTLEERLQRLEDEAAIRDLAARFADASTRGDHEAMLSLFAPDAVFGIGEPFAFTAHGTKEIAAFFHQLRDGKDFFVQFVHSGLIQLDGNRASARWLVHESASGPGHHGAEKGYYDPSVFVLDELEKIDGQWLLKKRNYPFIFISTDPFPGSAVPLDLEVSFK